MTIAYAWSPITKSEEQDDGTVIVYGPAASPALDRDLQVLSEEFLDRAMPEWFASGANVREQHDAKKAVGVGVGLTKGEDGAHLLAARIVDPVAVQKVRHGVLKGFSVGIKAPKVEMGKAEAPNGLVVDGTVCEVSVVDRPCNPNTIFEVAKADSAGDLAAVEDARVVEKTDTPEQAAADGEPEPDIAKADLSAAGRKKAAASGAAMPDGSYPISTKSDLRKAIKAVGRGGDDHDAIRRHIIKRAKALGLEALVPDSWNGEGATKADTGEVVAKAEAVLRDVRALVPELVTKADGEVGNEGDDIAGAQEAIACIAGLIVSEAEMLAQGHLNETYDIELLLQAVSSLKWFLAREQAENQGDDTMAMFAEQNPDMTKAEEPAAPAAPADAPAPETPAAETPAPEQPAEPVAEEAPETPAEETDTPEGAPKAEDAPLTRAEAEAAIAAAVEAALAEVTVNTPEPAPEPAEAVTKADLAELVKTAVAEATAARQRTEALEADLAKAAGTLAAMQDMPMPGGPALTRTAAEQAAATKSDAEILRLEADELLRKADSLPANSTLANGYRARARDLLTKAAA